MKFFCILAMAAAMALTIAGCAKPNDGEAEMREKLGPWFDALDLAKKSPRSSLAPQIAEMQRMRREAENIEVSPCMKEPKKRYVEYMQSKIDIFSDILSGKDVSVLSFNSPSVDLAQFNSATEACHTNQ